MRNISEAAANLNVRVRRSAPALPAIVLLAALAAGCGGGESGDASLPAPRVGTVDGHVVVVRIDAALALLDIADDLRKGEDIAPGAVDSLLARPSYRQLLTDRHALHPDMIARALREALAPDKIVPLPGDRRPDRLPAGLGENVAYVVEREARIRSLLDELADPQRCAAVFTAAEGFIPESAWPDTIHIEYIVDRAGHTLREGGHMIVDAGLALAAGPDKLFRMLAGQFYADAVPLREPWAVHETSGDRAVAATFDQLRFQGAMSWIMDFPHLVFDGGHPVLSRVNELHSRTRERGLDNIERIDLMLSTMVAQPGMLQEKGATIDGMLRINGLYSPMGYVMAETLAAVAGEARMREALLTTTAFLAAYQEAALAARTISSATPDTGPPPLSPAVIEAMRPLIAARDSFVAAAVQGE